MTEEQLNKLDIQKKHIKLKLDAAAIIKDYIINSWLQYFKDIIALGMTYHLAYLYATDDEEMLPYFKEALRKLNDPLLDPELIKKGERLPMNAIFDDFPSLSHFKYQIDLPVFSEYGGDASEMLLKAKEILKIGDGPVYFISNDTSPLLKLQLNELISHGNALFNDGGLITLIFTDPENKWIIFRNIEEEWRCGFWKHP